MSDQRGPEDEELVLFAGIGGALRKLRTGKRKTLENVAAVMGGAANTIKNWETPSARPTISTVDKYLRAIGCSPRDLVDALPRPALAADAVAEPVAIYEPGEDELVDAALRAAVIVLKRENDQLRRDLAAAEKRAAAPATEGERSLSVVEEAMQRRLAAQASDSPGSGDDPNAPSSTGGES